MRSFIGIAGILALLLHGPAAAETMSAAGRGDAVVIQAGAVKVKKSEESRLRAAIGQMIIVGFEGASSKDANFRHLLGKAQRGEISGVLYLQRNLRSSASVIAMNAALQKVAPVPVLIAIDQEGGAIQRIPDGLGFPRVPSARTVANKLSPRKAFEAYATLARSLHAWGFNLNLGPVADLDVNPKSPIIGRLGRSFSGAPETVVQYSAAFVDAHRQYGVLTSLKHFPGHGSAKSDSHNRFVDVTETSKPAELTVFRDLIAEDFADVVMIGHTFDAKLQPNGKLPATLDGQIVTKLLRGKFGYKGAVITDDLEMAAVADSFSLRERVIRAVLAGNDLLVFGNSKSVDPDIDQKVTAILLAEAESNPDMRRAIARSAARISALKGKLGDGVDGMSTRSIGSYLTPEFVDAQTRPAHLVPVF